MLEGGHIRDERVKAFQFVKFFIEKQRNQIKRRRQRGRLFAAIRPG
jgi:hypothetical protein